MPDTANSTPAYGWAAQSPTKPLAPFHFARRALRPHDVSIDILYCGVCHSDLHTARDEWHGTQYPIVPGHEIVGRVAAVGSAVTSRKPGDLVGVGCMVDSCRTCRACREGLEQYCESGFVGTYGGVDKESGEPTQGGYSDHIVVDERFVLRLPEGLALEGAAPLLCAGITTYSPLHHFGAGKGTKVGVVGLGGLGHMAVKIAHAMGAEVTLFTSSPHKRDDGKRLGADEVVVSKDEAAMQKQAGRLDLIVDTVSAQHDLGALLATLRRDGTMVLVGAPEHPLPLATFGLIFGRRRLAGSLIGGIRETQEMLDFCGQHRIVSDVEVIPVEKINEAYERMLKSDVRYRFVIDGKSLAGHAKK